MKDIYTVSHPGKLVDQMVETGLPISFEVLALIAIAIQLQRLCGFKPPVETKPTQEDAA